MKNKTNWLLALFCTLTVGVQVQAADTYDSTGTQVSRPADTNMDDDVRDINDVDADTSDTWSSSTEPSDQNINVDVNNQPATVAPAAAETRGEVNPPRSYPSFVRLIPAAGASSFTSANEATLDNLDDGFTAGIFADFGSNTWVFETGVLALTASGDTSGDSAAVDVDSWGIPLLAKINFSGKPQSTVFLKVGAMPFQPSGASDDFDVLGVAGIGGAIPLFRNTALTLDASYNRLFDDSGELGTYQGIALLGGLQFGL